MPIIRPPDFAPIVRAIVALAGGGQPGATQLIFGTNCVETVAAPNDSVLLPLASGTARNLLVENRSVNLLSIFPQVGQQIGLQAINSAILLAAGRSMLFVDHGADGYAYMQSA